MLNPARGYGQLQSDDSASSGGSDAAATVQLPLDRIDLAPFYETLPLEHQPLASSISYEDEMLRLYLNDFFAAAAAKSQTADALQVSVGTRFQIDGVDWRVLAAYPPAGIVTAKTSVRCMSKPLSAIATLSKLHVLPVMATLPRAPNPDTREMEPKMPSADELFREYVRPWIAGVGAAASSSSSSSSSAAAAASSHDPEPKHIVEGELFVYRGVQFKVVSCLPSNGVVTADTEVFTTGPPLADITKLQIHPIYESQPNSEKAWTGAQLFQKYLLPFFQGRFRFIKQGDRIEIDGVSTPARQTQVFLTACMLVACALLTTVGCALRLFFLCAG